MDENQKTPSQMTVVEAIEKLEEFKQKVVDQGYEEMVQEGFINTNFTFEQLEALEVVLYYLDTLSQIDDDEL